MTNHRVEKGTYERRRRHTTLRRQRHDGKECFRHDGRHREHSSAQAGDGHDRLAEDIGSPVDPLSQPVLRGSAVPGEGMVVVSVGWHVFVRSLGRDQWKIVWGMERREEREGGWT